MGRTTAALLIVVLSACAEDKPAPRRDIGQQMGDLAADTATLKQAQAAANEVVRNAGDCDLAKPGIVEANRRLDEAMAKVRTATGRTTLDVLRKRVSTVADACP
jgi:hypothetical protein